jgi:hypothetical protein
MAEGDFGVRPLYIRSILLLERECDSVMRGTLQFQNLMRPCTPNLNSARSVFTWILGI